MAKPKKIKQERILSASRIKTWEDCSWKYWCNYHLKIPGRNNDGAARGTVCHRIFELLLIKKNKKYYDLILEKGNTEASPAVTRLVRMLLKEGGTETGQTFYNKENFELCLNMIFVGLSFDFFGKGGKVDRPEIDFTLESKDPKYKIRGFIDKKIKYKDKVKIVDYKSSKRKFSKEDLAANVQAMAYTLAAKKMHPKNTRTIVEFLFLKFPRQPSQEVEISEAQIKGFEEYMGYVYERINNFTEKDAMANYAKDKAHTRFFCKAGAHWKCPYLEEFNYYAVVDKDNNVIKSSLNKDVLAPEKDQKIVIKKYEGCPAHAQTDDDPFNF